MTLAERPALSRAAALAILAVLVVLFCGGPLTAYCGLVADGSDGLATEAELLQRYRALADAKVASSSSAPEAALLYPDMPESQASALLQETLKTAAAAAHAQVLGLQMLRSEAANGATRIGVRVRASGDMASLRGLLYAIESARPVLYTDNLSIQSHAATSDAAPSPLDFQFDVSGFKTEPKS
ncbi:MAG: type II secretion system protein GspM [Stellaceae bacterium]